MRCKRRYRSNVQTPSGNASQSLSRQLETISEDAPDDTPVASKCPCSRALQRRKNSSIDSIYHERQRLLFCGVHAVNNLLQHHAFSKQDFEAIANAQFRQQLNEVGSENAQRLSSRFGLGNFDQQVLESALLVYGYEMVRSTVGDVGLFSRADIGKSLVIEPSPNGPKHPPIVRMILPACPSSSSRQDLMSESAQHHRSSSSTQTQFEVAIDVEWSGSQATLTSSDFLQWLPAQSSSDSDAADSWHIVQENSLKLTIASYQEASQQGPSSQKSSSDFDVRAQITLSNGWSFKNPLDLWTPLGFIKRFSTDHMFGLLHGGHWAAIRKHPTWGADGDECQSASGSRALVTTPRFYDLDSKLRHPVHLPYFCDGDCREPTGDATRKCNCTVTAQLCDTSSSDAGNIFVVRKIKVDEEPS